MALRKLPLRLQKRNACPVPLTVRGTLDDLVEAVETLEAVAKLWKRVMGERHPETPAVLEALKVAREKLRLRRAAREVASD